MPKRKHSEDEDSDKLWRKIRRMEKKLKKRKKRLYRLNSSSSDSPSNIAIPSTNEDVEDILPGYEQHDYSYNIGAETPLTPCLQPNEMTAPSVDPLLLEPPAEDATGSAEMGSLTIADKSTNEEIVLGDEIMSFLGEAPIQGKKFGPKIHTEVARRWEHIATSGISKDIRKEFLNQYLTPENCSLVDPPALNLEVKAAITDSLLKKDTAIYNKQKQIAAAVACIGQAFTQAFCNDKKDTKLIKLLIDSGRIICDIQHTESIMRRGYISSSIKKDVKDHLNETQIDKFLFGEKLADTLKAAKTINKSGSEIGIAASTPRPLLRNRLINRPLNSRVPATVSRLPLAGRRFEQTTPAPPLATSRRRAPPPPPPAPTLRSQQRPRARRRQ